MKEGKIYSQNGEDGIIQSIYKSIGIKKGVYVEIGSGNGTECNTRLLRKNGWKGWMFDKVHKNKFVNKETFTKENTTTILEKYNVPITFDLLSIDIDGIDFYVLSEILKKYHPKIIVAEYNASLGTEKSISVEYNENFKWDKTNYFGCSLKALFNLCLSNKYILIYCDSTGTNCFFIRVSDYIKKLFRKSKPKPLTKRKFIEV